MPGWRSGSGKNRIYPGPVSYTHLVCEIYTDVEGVYTADPRVVPNARKLAEVSYDEMLEFASLGAQVLHNRSVEMAKKYGVQLVVLSSLTRAEGPIVKEATKVERTLILSLIHI